MQPTGHFTGRASRLDDVGSWLPAEAILILIDLARQTADLHASGRLHRQILVETIRLSAEGRATLEPPSPLPVRWPASLSERLGEPFSVFAELEIPASFAEAAAFFTARGIAAAPQLLDIAQLTDLTCRFLAGQSAAACRSNPVLLAPVPDHLRKAINTALHTGQFGCPARIETLIELLESVGVDAPRGMQDNQPGEETGSILRDLRQDTMGVHGLFNDSSSEPTRLDLAIELPFKHLGHYLIESRIGHGGMGDVFLGYDEPLRRHVAIKVLPEHLARDETAVRRFYSEAAAAAKLSHPNTVEIYYVGCDAGHYFFSMRYVEGESLSQRLRRSGAMPTDRALDIIEQVLAGLAAAHRLELVHRDIKPGNILLEAESNRAFLADFGLAKSTQESQALTATGVVLGTVNYVSPEQGRGLPLDQRSDLYSLGVVMFQMFSGRLPFIADNPTAMIFKHVYEPPPLLSELVNGIPSDLARMVDMLLAKSPDERYQSADDALVDLRAVRAGQPLRWDRAALSRRDATESRGIDGAAPDTIVRALQLDPPLAELSVADQIQEYERQRGAVQRQVTLAETRLEQLTETHADRCRALERADALARAAENETARLAHLRDADACRTSAETSAREMSAQRTELDAIRLHLARLVAALNQLRARGTFSPRPVHFAAIADDVSPQLAPPPPVTVPTEVTAPPRTISWVSRAQRLATRREFRWAAVILILGALAVSWFMRGGPESAPTGEWTDDSVAPIGIASAREVSRVIAFDEQQARLLDARRRAFVRILPDGNSNSITAAAHAPGDPFAILGHIDGALVVIDTNTLGVTTLLDPVGVAQAIVRHIQFSADGRRLICLRSNDRGVWLFKLDSASDLKATLRTLLPTGDSPLAADISSDGRSLAVVTVSKEPTPEDNELDARIMIRVYETEGSNQIREFPWIADRTRISDDWHLACSEDGSRVLVADAVNLALFNVTSGIAIQRLALPNLNGVIPFCELWNDKWIVAGDREKVMIWNAETGQPVKTITTTDLLMPTGAVRLGDRILIGRKHMPLLEASFPD